MSGVSVSLSTLAASLSLAVSAAAQPVPPETPQVLGQGTISLEDRHEFCATMAFDQRTVFIGIEHGDWQSMLSYHWEDDRWVGPEEVLGTPEYNAHDPYLSADEQRLYFITGANGHADIGYLVRGEDGRFEGPTLLGPPVNGPANEYYTSFTVGGDLIFASDRASTQPGDYDIYRAAPVPGGFAEPVRFPAGINTMAYEGDPFIDPHGRYLIFASNRPGGQGRGDLYLSVADDAGGWSEPIAFDQTINTPAHQLCPLVTLDGSAFLFTSDQDIHWVSVSKIEHMIAAYKAASAGD